jgi:putative oxygen-independent coproporphyrinogen III oxidase
VQAGNQAEAWKQRIGPESASERALYLHVPFCARKCAYCDFASSAARADDPLLDAYLDALLLELGEARDAGLLEDARTAYVGGGTPTLLGEGRLARLVGAVVRAMGQAPEELTVEANPDSLAKDMPEALREAGATRLSVGVQSLDDAELKALGRIHSADQAREALGRAAASGLDVSADLMCAIPLQTEASFARSIEGVLASGVGHVSVYPLILEEGTAFEHQVEAGELELPDDDAAAALMLEAERVLASAGLVRYEVASYAKPGKSCAHNVAYWTGLPYLGLGTSAASMLTPPGYGRLRAIAPQLPELAEDVARVRLTITSFPSEIAASPRLSDLRFDVELLDERQLTAEDLMLASRLSAGIGPDLASFAREVIGEPFDEAIGQAEEEGLLDRELRPTEQGWLLGNRLYGLLWDLAGEAPVRTLSVGGGS